MEITNEIKAKVLSHYLGQKVDTGGWLHKEDECDRIILYSDIDRWVGGIGFYYPNKKDCAKSKLLELPISDIKLILKPISSITDEDKEWLADLFGWKEVKNISVGAFLSELIKTEYNLYRADKTIIAIQYLQENGYDLPHYLLGGEFCCRTLQQAGLAVYEK